MDNELFELCKQVYESTNYDWTDVPQYLTQTGMTIVPDTNLDAITPLYTSDYLLEKLPAHYINNSYLALGPSSSKWMVGYMEDHELKWLRTEADTPLKALLKLTLALNDAGILKAKDKKAA